MQIMFQDAVLWDMGQGHCGVCEIVYQVSMVHRQNYFACYTYISYHIMN